MRRQRPRSGGSRSATLHGLRRVRARTSASWSGSSAREGAVWAVGRAVNPQHRAERTSPGTTTTSSRGYELEDALEQANGVARRRRCACPRTTAARSTSDRSRARSCSARSSAGSSGAARRPAASLRRVLIRLGHSPDPDDAFMFWALAAGRVDTRGFEFEHVLQDIQTLNEWALEGRLEVTAISLHAYPFVQDRYVLLPHGASMGSGYGPIVVAREPLDAGRAARRRDRRARADDDRVPRRCAWRSATSATARCRSTRSSTRCSRADADAGLLIHEGQLTYADAGPAEGASTSASGGCSRRACRCRSARTSRGATSARSVLRELSAVLARLDPRRARQPRARRWRTRCSSAAASTTELADRFVGMYVNELTRATTATRGGSAVERAARAAASELGACHERPVQRRVRRVVSARRRPRRGPHARRPLRRRALGRAAGRSRSARDRGGGRARGRRRRARSRTSTSAARTRRARTTATSRAWPRCSPGCRSRSRA